ncbi:putative circularly permuted ATP-grasp superfamily protein [Chitinophaga skermanii]|uniref:Putative circularly permuted ATP-grasp superfamily protein n=1 Tax=Chitinophaga skermanii TaxID=331697 RepID=A0A327QNK9_9BACT|nr:hypothetical protein [Chitinophaga skermanii]RAJ05242.1 putative circularly permuted ATP-grasp superfamily protein [Chitinophaga skermanii]
MIPATRSTYNQNFTKEAYDAFLRTIWQENGLTPVFRIAETPVFIPADLTGKMIQAGEEIINVIQRADFKAITENAIPDQLRVPNENEHPHCLVVDFAVCKNAAGELVPQLIELQGFPSLFAFQDTMASAFKQHFHIPDHVNNFFHGYDTDTYYALLKRIIVANENPENVVLLEVRPKAQKTYIDFHITAQKLGIKILCISDLKHEGRQLYYEEGDVRIPIHRIYNRVIFDDLQQQKDSLPGLINIFQEYDVTWVPHPNWFYRISKYTMPFIHSDYVPKTWFLHELPVIPTDLENYVLKPLFSFAGQGVKIDVQAADIEAIEDPENWILQKKVQYAPVVETPTGPAIAEIRLMYFWEDGAERPTLVHNLARISKGKMIGVSFNDDISWVGGSCSFFETHQQPK